MRSRHAPFCKRKAPSVRLFAALFLLAAGTIPWRAAASALPRAQQEARPQASAPPQAPAESAPPPQYDIAIFQNPIPSDQLAFLNQFSGMEADKLIRDKDYRKLLKQVIPNCEFHYGHDMPLSEAVDTVIKGSRQPVQIRDARYVMVSGQSGPYLLGRGFLWMDMQDGIALGGFYFHPTNGEPTPAVNIFSAQVKETAIEMNQLPAAFAEDFAEWAYAERVPAVTPRYFITGNKKKIVLQHDEDYCAPIDGSNPPPQDVCQQMNLDAADIDVEDAYYVDSTGHATNATAWMLNPNEFAVWIGQRNAACVAGPDPLGCRIRLAHEHVRVILNRHPLPPPR